MGRQVHISVLPDDVEALFGHLKIRHRVVVAKRDDPDSGKGNVYALRHPRI